ncbi:MAG: fibronectin type III domain-containing protein [Elusimicrobia bacterium]|nr:fibronectin type III domain-containing protein [Elusimicrobiota bacterium]
MPIFARRAGWVALFLCGSPLLAAGLTGTSHRIARDAKTSGGGSKVSISNGWRVVSSLGAPVQGETASGAHGLFGGPMRTFFFPGTITDLAVTTGPASGELRLAWSAPGADGREGRAALYKVRYSPFPAAILTQSDFETALDSANIVVPQLPNVAEPSFSITGLIPGTTYFVAVEARDADGNQAELSNVPSKWAQFSLLSVDISSSSYDFGLFSQSTQTVSTSTIRVINNGTLPSTWSLAAATTTAGSPWVMTSGSPAPDRVSLSAGFHVNRPVPAQFGPEDRMVPQGQNSSALAFSIDGTQTGAGVAPTAERNLWMLLETPTSSSVPGRQDFQITVVAGP